MTFCRCARVKTRCEKVILAFASAAVLSARWLDTSTSEMDDLYAAEVRNAASNDMSGRASAGPPVRALLVHVVGVGAREIDEKTADALGHGVEIPASLFG